MFRSRRNTRQLLQQCFKQQRPRSEPFSMSMALYLSLCVPSWYPSMLLRQASPATAMPAQRSALSSTHSIRLRRVSKHGQNTGKRWPWRNNQEACIHFDVADSQPFGLARNLYCFICARRPAWQGATDAARICVAYSAQTLPGLPRNFVWAINPLMRGSCKSHQPTFFFLICSSCFSSFSRKHCEGFFF